MELRNFVVHSSFDSEPEHQILTAIHIALSYVLNAKQKEQLRDKMSAVEVKQVPNRRYVVKKGKAFRGFFAEAVDETLKQIFKKEGARVIYDFLENKSCLKLEDVADNPEALSASLETLMVSASQVVELTILKNLYSKMGLKFEEKNNYKFSDYIKELREE
jgi:hypothetical protein